MEISRELIRCSDGDLEVPCVIIKPLKFRGVVVLIMVMVV